MMYVLCRGCSAAECAEWQAGIVHSAHRMSILRDTIEGATRVFLTPTAHTTGPPSLTPW